MYDKIISELEKLNDEFEYNAGYEEGRRRVTLNPILRIRHKRARNEFIHESLGIMTCIKKIKDLKEES